MYIVDMDSEATKLLWIPPSGNFSVTWMLIAPFLSRSRCLTAVFVASHACRIFRRLAAELLNVRPPGDRIEH